MRAMGLDLGTKTIGVAISDGLGITAQPTTTIRRQSQAKDMAALKLLVDEHEVTEFVLGLPLNMDGSEGPRAATTRKFGELLTATFALPVHYQDERLTTVAAERALLEGDVSREKRKQVIDQIAAALILQGWLDGRPKS
jgi:putative holliday junction resolvase